MPTAIGVGRLFDSPIREQRLRVFQPHVYARIGLTVAQMTDDIRLRVSGYLRPAPRRDQVWLKLVPLLTNGPTMDGLAGDDERFEFAGMEIGRYLILVIRGSECVATKQVEAPAGSVEIVLPKP